MLSSSSARSAKAISTMAVSAVAFLAKLYRPHLFVLHDLVRRALREHRALHQHGDFLGKTKDDVHVVLDNQYGDVGIKCGNHIENKVTFGRRDAGRRLIEQKNARFLRECNGDLDEPLAAIGQLADQLERVVSQPQRVEVNQRLIDHAAPGARRAPEIVAMTVALADCHAEILKHREPTEKLIDLKGAREPAPRAIGLAQSGDVVTVKQHATRMRLEHSGNQIDQRCLAGPIGADKCPACPAFERKIDVARHWQCAEGAIQSLNLQRGGHDGGSSTAVRLAMSRATALITAPIAAPPIVKMIARPGMPVT